MEFTKPIWLEKPVIDQSPASAVGSRAGLGSFGVPGGAVGRGVAVVLVVISGSVDA